MYTRIALLIASLGFMQNLDSAIINTSFPQMAHSFGVTAMRLSLGVTSYLLAVAAISPLSSWLMQRFGSRNVLALAVGLFTVASVCCGASHTLAMFVASRLLQGMGGALLAPVGSALVLRFTPKADYLRITSIMIWPVLMAPIIGPVIGGLITEHASWRWNFWLNVPVGIFGVIAILRMIPNEREEARRPIDLLGFAYCATALTCLLAGLQRASLGPAERRVTFALLGVGILAAVSAVRHLKRHATPLLSLKPLTRRSLRIAAIAPGAFFLAIFSSAQFLLPLLFQLGFGMSPATAGGWVLVYFCGNLGMKLVTTRILRTFGFKNVLVTNAALVALSLLLCVLMHPGLPKIALFSILLFAGCTRSMQMTAIGSVAYADVADTERSTASSLMAMIQQAASAAGVAVAALCISIFQGIHHSTAVAIADFHDTFAISAVIALAGTMVLMGVPRDIGSEISGRR
ncbi:MFS transporter [Silvibacterium sp.]|uniref:MFS transporter n=1 Tax=Silvibacterium sp. TaxID=1964179 RepID=UPI0039E59933